MEPPVTIGIYSLTAWPRLAYRSAADHGPVARSGGATPNRAFIEQRNTLMPDDGFQITTSAPRDALILGLAAAWRSADAVGSGLYAAVCERDAHDVGRELQGRSDAHAKRAKTLLMAICCVRAESLAGALMQMDALAQLESVRGEQAEPDVYSDHVRASVTRVLMIESQTAPADRLRPAGSLTTACLSDDPFCDDVAAVSAEIMAWKAACRPDKAAA
jgi:hypothetical protein